VREAFIIKLWVKANYEMDLFMSLPDVQRALAALREIQVKAVELPPSCEHDAHVIAALAVTVEQILSREIKDAA
jgi:hypothetical protein